MICLLTAVPTVLVWLPGLVTTGAPGWPGQVPGTGSAPVTLTAAQAALTVLYSVQWVPYRSAAAFSESVRALA